MEQQRERNVLRQQLHTQTQIVSQLLTTFEQQLSQGTVQELQKTQGKIHKQLRQQKHLLRQLEQDEKSSPLPPSEGNAQLHCDREQVLTLLHFLGVPAQPPLLHELLLIRYENTLSIPQLQKISQKEEQQYLRNPNQTPDWITPAINMTDGTNYPTYLTCSTWPLEQRIIGSLTLRTIHLSTLLSLLTLWTHLQQAISSTWTPVLYRLIMHLNTTVPTNNDPQDIGANQCVSALRRELDELQDLDLKERQEAALHYQHLSEHHRFWGRPLLIE